MPGPIEALRAATARGALPRKVGKTTLFVGDGFAELLHLELLPWIGHLHEPRLPRSLDFDK